jgi:hypothetical protein
VNWLTGCQLPTLSTSPCCRWLHSRCFAAAKTVLDHGQQCVVQRRAISNLIHYRSLMTRALPARLATHGGTCSTDFYEVNVFETIPSASNAKTHNSWRFLQDHITQCASIAGQDVNLVLDNFWDVGGVLDLSVSTMPYCRLVEPNALSVIIIVLFQHECSKGYVQITIQVTVCNIPLNVFLFCSA